MRRKGAPNAPRRTGERGAGGRARPWREIDFERWFVENPWLPDGERLTLVARHGALRRVIDLLFLDATGGLVLVEVKNETSSRAVIGQALEYLSQYEDADLESLLDESHRDDASKTPAMEAVSGLALSAITRRRRIVLAAPAFDLATQAAVVMLNRRFAEADLGLLLLAVARIDGAFRLRILEPSAPKSLRELQGKIGMNARGRLFFVLPGLGGELCVNLGRLREDRLSLPKASTATQRLLRRLTGSLIPYDGPLVADGAVFGSVWRHRRRNRKAVVFTRLRHRVDETSDLVYFGLLEAGVPIGYRIRSAGEFARWWVATNEVQPDLANFWTVLSRKRK